MIGNLKSLHPWTPVILRILTEEFPPEQIDWASFFHIPLVDPLTFDEGEG